MTDFSLMFSESFWYMAPILMGLTVSLSEVINGLCKVTKGWLKQVISWVLGAGLSVAAYFSGVLTVGDPQWLGVVALAVIVGLSSNGIYDIPTIKAFVSSWFASTKKVTE